MFKVDTVTNFKKILSRLIIGVLAATFIFSSFSVYAEGDSSIIPFDSGDYESEYSILNTLSLLKTFRGFYVDSNGAYFTGGSHNHNDGKSGGGQRNQSEAGSDNSVTMSATNNRPHISGNNSYFNNYYNNFYNNHYNNNYNNHYNNDYNNNYNNNNNNGNNNNNNNHNGNHNKCSDLK